jgi:hypothetical protein
VRETAPRSPVIIIARLRATRPGLMLNSVAVNSGTRIVRPPNCQGEDGRRRVSTAPHRLTPIREVGKGVVLSSQAKTDEFAN